MTAKRESGLRHRIALALRSAGCVVVTQHGGAFGAAGTSDLLACYKGRFVALEVKTETGRATPKQELFLEQVRRAGGTSAVVRSVREALTLMAQAADTELDDLFADLGLDATGPQSGDADGAVADVVEMVPPPADEVIITPGAVEGEGLDELFSVPSSNGSDIEPAVADTVIEGVKAARGKGKVKAPPIPPSMRDLAGTLDPGHPGIPLDVQIARLDQKFDRIMAMLAQVLESTARIIESARGDASGGGPAS